MFIVVTLIAVFILISIYLFFRAEGLQKELGMVKREAKHLRNDNKGLVESMVMAANKNEEFCRFRLNELKAIVSEDKLTPELKEDIEMLILLTSNYSAIYRECLKGNTQLKTIAKTCLDALSPGTYNNFTHYIANQEIGIKRMWAGNNLQGFISMVEAMMLQLNKNLLNEAKKQSA